MKPFDCARESLDRGVTLLEASAGTGKTYALARIFLRLVVEEGVEVGKLLTVTFTKAATEELKGRIRELLVDALASFQGEKCEDEDPTITRLKQLESVPIDEGIRRLRLAITCFDEAIISTIHGFCQRVLAENSLETNSLFEAELDQSSPALVAEAVRDYWRAHFSEASPLISAIVSTEKIKPASVIEFYKKLPSTQDYQIGFSHGQSLEEIQGNLFDIFDRLRALWIGEKEEYLEFVAIKIRKYTASKKAVIHSALLDDVFQHDQRVTPAFIEVFDFVRASKLKLLKDFEDEAKPSFSLVAEEFWDAVECFSQALRADTVNFIDRKISEWKGERGFFLLMICSV
jgi:ATP-dependent exoDNAse (exonuclease V) beta subunit